MFWQRKNSNKRTSENILTDQCLAQSSSEKLPHVADENKRRGHSQKIFKVRDLETLSHARDVFKNSLLPELRKFYIREGKKDCKRQKEYRTPRSQAICRSMHQPHVVLEFRVVDSYPQP